MATADIDTTAELPDTFDSVADMQAVIDAAVAQSQAERAEREPLAPPPEPTQKAPEPAPQPKPQPAPQPVSETPSDAQSQKVDEPVSSAPDWITDEIAAQARRFGLTDEDLREFDDHQGLEKALGILERREYKRLREQQVPQKAPTPPPAQAPQAAAPAPVAATPPPVAAGGESFPVALDPEQYDPEVKSDLEKNLAKLNEHWQKKHQALEQRLQGVLQQEAQREMMGAYVALESSPEVLSNPDLFGKPGERTEVQRKNYDELATACVTIAGMRGVNPSSSTTNETIRQKAMYYAFGQTIVNKEKQKTHDRIRQQSARRMGGPSGKPLHGVPTNGPPIVRGKDGEQIVTPSMADLQAEYDRLSRES